MTLKELLDVTDPDRGTDWNNEGSIIKLMGKNGTAEMTVCAASKFLKLIENREIDSMGASGEDTYEIWLKDDEIER